MGIKRKRRRLTLDDLVFSNIERRPVDPGTLTKLF
jgi:hypothetical protein